MNPSQAQHFYSEIERWSGMLLDLGLPEKWVEGAIYPREMVFFMAACVVSGSEVVVECGRQDGYSTEILGEFGRRSGLEIVSIDIEYEKERGRRCRERLAHLPIKMVVGDAFEEVGKIVLQERRKIAFVVDGPKDWGAMSLLAAAAVWDNVQILSMHNLDVGYTTRDFLKAEAKEPIFYEGVVDEGIDLPRWRQLAEAETSHLTQARAARLGEDSSLGLIWLDAGNRKSIASLKHAGFRTYPPGFVRWAWRSGSFGLLKKTFALTNRFLGPENKGKRAHGVAA